VSRYIDEHRGRFGVEPICGVLGVSASAYYQRANGERSARAIEDERLLGRIRELHAANYYAYGSRRMWKALRRAGEQVGRCRVERLMRIHGLQGAKRRGTPWRTTTPDPFASRRPDLVQRDFTASGPNRLWVGDLTYLRCWEGIVFFAFILDVYSRRIVGWQFASHMRTELVLDALRMAIDQRGPGADVQLVAHTDRGSQYTSIAYTDALAEAGILASVGSVGDAYDPRLASSRRSDRSAMRTTTPWPSPSLTPSRPTDRRSRLAISLAARAGDRRVCRLVQHHASARVPRRSAAGGVRGSIRTAGPDDHTLIRENEFLGIHVIW
jgi:putative transposase